MLFRWGRSLRLLPNPSPLRRPDYTDCKGRELLAWSGMFPRIRLVLPFLSERRRKMHPWSRKPVTPGFLLLRLYFVRCARVSAGSPKGGRGHDVRQAF